LEIADKTGIKNLKIEYSIARILNQRQLNQSSFTYINSDQLLRRYDSTDCNWNIPIPFAKLSNHILVAASVVPILLHNL